MKKLLLTSYAHKTLDFVRPLLPKDPKDLVAIFIATAADPYEDKSFIDVDRTKLVSMGFTVIDLDINNKTELELDEQLKQADVIFVAGGNVYYLLQAAQQSSFIKALETAVARGVVYVGSSAGSLLMCPTVDAARRFDAPEAAPDLNGTDGLGLVDFIILPHFEKPRYLERMRQTIVEWSGKGYQIYPLTDEQAIVVDGDKSWLVEVGNN